jgi:hypothetical protein
MWGWLILLLGLVFHSRSGRSSVKKSSKHRQFYKHGQMWEELDALDSIHEGLEMVDKTEKRKK